MRTKWQAAGAARRWLNADSRKEYSGCRAAAAAYDQYIEELETTRRVLGCGYCGEKVWEYGTDNPSPSDHEAALEAFYAHDAACPENPLAKRAADAKADRNTIENLIEENAALRKALQADDAWAKGYAEGYRNGKNYGMEICGRGITDVSEQESPIIIPDNNGLLDTATKLRDLIEVSIYDDVCRDRSGSMAHTESAPFRDPTDLSTLTVSVNGKVFDVIIKDVTTF